MSGKKRFPAALPVAHLTIDASLQSRLQLGINATTYRHCRNIILECDRNNRVNVGLVKSNIEDIHNSSGSNHEWVCFVFEGSVVVDAWTSRRRFSPSSVSYTHLTLPTNC